MSASCFTQDISRSLEAAIGVRGAPAARFDHWCAQAQAAFTRLRAQPVPEAASILKLPAQTDDLAEIESLGSFIREHCDTLVLLGMGGSSLSGEALSHLAPKASVKLVVVDTLDPARIAAIIENLSWKTTAFVAISKSGNTAETQAQLSVFLREATVRGADIAQQFTILTIPNDNPLHRLARALGIRVLPHDPDLCGRFSILSSVGLLPAAAMGLGIRALRAGAAATWHAHHASAIEGAALHRTLMEVGTTGHVLMHYVDGLSGLVSWVRQCWAESLGKSGTGTLLIPSRGPCDQHSQLQLYLEGPSNIAVTSLVLNQAGQGAPITMDAAKDTRFDYLSGKRLGDLLMAEQQATHDSLAQQGCPVRVLTLAQWNEEAMGALLMHFTLEVMLLAELLGVNAFNQPAVEEGKRLALKYLAG